MSNFVEDGFKVINVDNRKLEELRSSENALDTGALKILESLDMFCDDLADGYSYSSQIGSSKLFNALRTVIKSAYENEKIRNAIMTGIICDAPKREIETRRAVEKKLSGVRTKDLEKESVVEYSKTHTISESAEYFGVSKEQMKNYICWHDIEYIADKAGRKSSLDKNKILEVSSEMTIKELAALFNVKPGTMAKFCERNNIPHKRRN